LLGSAAQIGRYRSSKAKYWREKDSEKVTRGKDEKHLETGVKSELEIVKRQKLGRLFKLFM